MERASPQHQPKALPPLSHLQHTHPNHRTTAGFARHTHSPPSPAAYALLSPAAYTLHAHTPWTDYPWTDYTLPAAYALPSPAAYALHAHALWAVVALLVLPLLRTLSLLKQEQGAHRTPAWPCRLPRLAVMDLCESIHVCVLICVFVSACVQ